MKICVECGEPFGPAEGVDDVEGELGRDICNYCLDDIEEQATIAAEEEYEADKYDDFSEVDEE